MEKVIVSKGITQIAAKAFYGCSELKNVEFKDADNWRIRNYSKAEPIDVTDSFLNATNLMNCDATLIKEKTKKVASKAKKSN